MRRAKYLPGWADVLCVCNIQCDFRVKTRAVFDSNAGASLCLAAVFRSTHFSGGFYVCPQFARSFFDALMRRAAD
jgi:hypothetical protein